MTPKNFNSKLSCLILLIIIFLINHNTYSLDISATSAILVEPTTQQILYAKEINKRMPIASLTKIMTAIIILERGNLQEMVTISKRAAERESGESAIWLEEGEQLTLEDLLYAILVKSANDAAVGSAEHIAGSVENFVEMMNQKAKDLGAYNTHFSNPHGFYGKQHYSTAYDLSLITRYALQNEKFREIIQTKKKIIPWPGNPWNRVLKNRNKLLWKYPYANGVKTGYTKESGHCLVGSATKNNFSLLAIVLKSSNVWQDTINLFEYGFNNFKPQYLVRSGQNLKRLYLFWGKPHYVDLVAKDNLIHLIKNNQISNQNLQEPPYINPEVKINLNPFSLPIKKDQVIGKVILKYKGKEIGKTDLVAKNSVERDWLLTSSFFFILLFLGVFIIRRNIKKNRKKKRRFNYGSRGIKY